MVTSKPYILPQDPPNAIQLELVEGCSLNCQFCGVQGIRTKKGGYKHMSAAVMKTFCRRLAHAMANDGWNPRIELAMHGEPTMHPDLVEMVTHLGRLKPRELILVSNGTGLCSDPNTIIGQLIEAGVTSICLDEYEGCNFVQRIRDRYTGPVPIVAFEEGKKFRGAKTPTIVVKGDVSNLTTPYDKVNTHCGGGGPPSSPNPAIHKRCAKPFRELAIRWDGNVALCCNDFRGLYKIGNIAYFETLEDLWQHKRFQAARQMLYAGSREFVPCQWCDALSPRVGLLPDKYGKQHLPAPTRATAQTLQEAVASPAWTMPVLRGWEVGASPCLPPGYDVAGLAKQPLDEP